MRQSVATNPAVPKLQVSFHVITEGEGLRTIHKATTLGPASLIPRLNEIRISPRLHQLLIGNAVINADTLHKAEFAWAHVQKGGTHMPLSWVLVVVHLLLAPLQIRVRAQSFASVASLGAGHGAAAEVPKGPRFSRETDKALQGGVIVSMAGEGECPITVYFPHILLGVEDEGGATLGTDEDGSIWSHAVGVGIRTPEWRISEFLPHPLSIMFRLPEDFKCANIQSE